MSRVDKEPVEVSVEFKHETAAAILVSDGDKDVWIPKSQMHDYTEWVNDKGDHITIEISGWIAKEKGLI